MFESLLASGDIEPRSLGWFKVNIEDNPDLKMEGIDKPNQIITGHRLMKQLNFVDLKDSVENEA